MKPGITYHRVSTRDQNPELAREELRAGAAMRRLTLIDEIEETGSGARNDRPGLQRVLELARTGRIAWVLVWKLDRFGRSALDVLTNVRALTDAGVTFVCSSQGIEVGPDAGAMGKLILTVLAAVAEFEREIIRERTVLGHAAARKAGKRIGRPRGLTPADVARAVELRRAGASWGAIAAAMPVVTTKHKGKPRTARPTRGAVERIVCRALSQTGVPPATVQSPENTPSTEADS